MPRKRQASRKGKKQGRTSAKRRRLDAPESKDAEEVDPDFDPQELLSDELEKALQTSAQNTESSAYFCVSGTAKCPLIHHLELSQDFAFGDESFLARAAELADDAPLGIGAETVIDPTRRVCKQLTNDKFIVLSPEWLPNTSNSNGMLEIVRQNLAPHAPFIMAQLHKINLYPTRGFFKPHADTWRSDGHVGSLVVFLPTQYSGGEFIVEHQGKRKEFSLGDADDPQQCHWVAFYADCPHEVRPVTEGFRMSLTYHLFLPPNVERPIERASSPEPSNLAAAVGRVLRMYGGETPKCVVFPLAFRYVYSAVSPTVLKGTDRILYSALSGHFALKFSCVGVAKAECGVADDGDFDEVYEDVDVQPPPVRVQLCKPDYVPEPFAFGHPNEIVDHVVEHDPEARELIVNPRQFLIHSELLDKQIEGTGNEGCSIYSQYRGVGLVVYRHEDAAEFAEDRNPPKTGRGRRGRMFGGW